jgi:general secretion pathway protein H
MCPQKKQAGFTLIEIMVVVIIIGIIVSTAFLSMGAIRKDRDLTTEARRFIALAAVAQDEAAMQGREFGIELMTSGYRFVEFDGFTGQWADVPGDELLRTRGLSEGLEIELFMEGIEILLDDDPAPFEDPNASGTRAATEIYAPHLFIFSSGDATPFEVQIIKASHDLRVVLRGDALGLVEIIDPDEI